MSKVSPFEAAEGSNAPVRPDLPPPPSTPADAVTPTLPPPANAHRIPTHQVRGAQRPLPTMTAVLADVSGPPEPSRGWAIARRTGHVVLTLVLLAAAFSVYRWLWNEYRATSDPAPGAIAIAPATPVLPLDRAPAPTEPSTLFDGSPPSDVVLVDATPERSSAFGSFRFPGVIERRSDQRVAVA